MESLTFVVGGDPCQPNPENRIQQSRTGDCKMAAADLEEPEMLLIVPLVDQVINEGLVHQW